MGLNVYLESKRKLIDARLDAYLPRCGREPATLHRAMRYSVFSGGKRIRPIILMESAGSCVRGGISAAAKGVFAAACAVELVHTYSLVHDDLPSMDDDDYRRGVPTCHKKFGEANAVLAGDGMLTLAFNIMAKDMPAGISRLASHELSEAAGTCGMVGGQALDIEFCRRRKDAKTLNHINLLKTARLFASSARLGAIAVKAGDSKAEALFKYGMLVGRAFQIVDDIIDGDGYADIFGKVKARADAARLVKKAKAEVGIFGSKSKMLQEIADYILHRVK